MLVRNKNPDVKVAVALDGPLVDNDSNQRIDLYSSWAASPFVLLLQGLTASQMRSKATAASRRLVSQEVLYNGY